MNETVSHDRQEETPEAKAQWFQSLSLSERMERLCLFTDLILHNNPRIAEQENAQPIASKLAAGREIDLEDVRLLQLGKGKVN